MWTKIFLGVTGFAFASYGLMCLVDPGVVANAAKLGLGNDVALAEARAMYGGLQTAVGVFALLALFRPALERPALVSLVFLFTGLAAGRLVGIAVASDAGAYNVAVFGYETVSAIVAAVLVRQSAKLA